MLGRIKGPFETLPFKNFQISPIGLVPKKDPNSFRLITHLSFPDGSSINDGISSEFAHVRYSSIDDAIKMILRLGKGAYLAKVDIKSAFRLIPLAPSQYHLFCYKWKDKYYYDCCLPMGARSACNIFESFSSSFELILKHENIMFVIHFLDDFLVANINKQYCCYDLNKFEYIADDLNVPLRGPYTIN